MCKLNLLIVTVLFTTSVFSQTETEKITHTLNHYIEGTANGEPNRLRKAFHEDFELYFVKNDSVKIWSGKEYIMNFKKGIKTNRIGKIVSIDYEGDAATAKVEVDMPLYNRLYTDYLLLLKYQGQWKIIHKSFSFKTY